MWCLFVEVCVFLLAYAAISRNVENKNPHAGKEKYCCRFQIKNMSSRLFVFVLVSCSKTIKTQK